MHAGGTGMNNAFWNALVIKVGDLFAEDEILEQRRAARSGPEGILIVRPREALVRREAGMPCKRNLVQFATGRRSYLRACGRCCLLFAFS